MAVTFRSIGALADGANNARDLAPGVPPGLAEGDVVLFVAISGAGGEWNSIEDNNGVAATLIEQVSTANFTGSFWWYRCPAVVPTSFAANRNTGGAPLVVGYAFSGCVATVTPFEGADGLFETATAETTPDSAAVTTTGAGRMLVVACGVDDDPDYSSGMPPAGFTDAGGVSTTSGSDVRIDLIYKDVPAAATEPAVVFGTLPGAEFWASMSLALLPAETGGDVVIDQDAPGELDLDADTATATVDGSADPGAATTGGDQGTVTVDATADPGTVGLDAEAGAAGVEATSDPGEVGLDADDGTAAVEATSDPAGITFDAETGAGSLDATSDPGQTDLAGAGAGTASIDATSDQAGLTFDTDAGAAGVVVRQTAPGAITLAAEAGTFDAPIIVSQTAPGEITFTADNGTWTAGRPRRGGGLWTHTTDEDDRRRRDEEETALILALSL